METEKINRIKEALHKVKRAAYLAFRKDENNINNQHWEYEVLEAFELIEPLCYYDYEFVFGNSLTQRGLRNEVAMNLMNHPNERRFVMKETIWALFEPFANNNFDGEKTVCIHIFSYGEEVMKCTLLDVWENANYTIDFEKKVRGRTELEYLYYANTLALHMMEALQDIVEKGSFDAVSDTEVENEPAISQTINPVSAESKQAKRNGKPKTSLKDKMLDDADGRKWQKLHNLMKGKKNTDAVLIIWCCCEKDIGWMQRPTSTQVFEEFGYDVFSKTWFNECFRNPSKFKQSEIELVKTTLLQALKQA